MSTTIRKANQQDFPAVLSLMQEFALFQQTPEKVTVTLKQLVADKDIFQCFVAETATKDIVGFASFFFTYYSWTGKAVYLDDLYVKPGYRKNSIGKMLLNEVLELAKKEQCKKVRWQVSKWNTNAIEFYRSIGAVIDETEINCDLVLTQPYISTPHSSL